MGRTYENRPQSRPVHHPFTHGLAASNFWVQQYRGEPVLKEAPTPVKKGWPELG